MKKIFELFVVSMLMACAETIQMDIEKSKYLYSSENYCEVIDNICEINNFSKLNNLNSLIASDVLFQNNNSNTEIVIDKINNVINKENSTINSITNGIGGALINDYVNEYQPMQMDGLFLSEYQILNYMIQGDFDSARVAINQGYYRQQQATQVFNSLIKERKQRTDANKLNSEEQGALSSYLNYIDSEYLHLDKWEVYEDIVSPVLTYISGLYYLNMSNTQNEFEDALTYMKRCYGMNSNSKTIVNDLSAAKMLVENGTRIKNKAWVIVESGFAPYLTEQKINLPSFLISSHITVIPFAFSIPKTTPDIGKYLKISSGNNTSNMEIISDVNKIFMTEFKEYSSIRITKALVNSITKLAMQYAARETSKQLGGAWGLLELGAMLYTIGTNSSDIRSWYTLPNKVRIASVKKDSNGLIKLIQNDKIIKTIKTNPEQNSLIYIRMASKGSVGLPKVIEFKRR